MSSVRAASEVANPDDIDILTTETKDVGNFHDFSLEAPLQADECALTARNYKVAASVGLLPDFMIATPVLVDTGATMNLIHHRFLPVRWRSAIQPYKGSQVKSANESVIAIVGVIHLCVRLGDLQVRVRFGVVDD